MPKLKTRKSISNRMKITKNGKALRAKPGARHNKVHKSGARVRKLGGVDIVRGKLAKTMKVLMAPGQ